VSHIWGSKRDAWQWLTMLGITQKKESPKYKEGKFTYVSRNIRTYFKNVINLNINNKESKLKISITKSIVLL